MTTATMPATIITRPAVRPVTARCGLAGAACPSAVAGIDQRKAWPPASASTGASVAADALPLAGAAADAGDVNVLAAVLLLLTT